MQSLPKSIILFIDSTNLGGAELALLELLKQFNLWGIDCHLVTTSRGSLFPEFQKYTKSQLITPFPYPSKIASWIHYFSFKRKVSKFINALPRDRVILVGDYYPLWAALLVKKQTNTPVYSIWQGEYVFEDDSCLEKWIKYGANRADKLIASQPICSHARPYNFFNKCITPLNPKVDLSRFDPQKHEHVSIRKELGFDDSDKLAICVGRVGVGKGQPWLVESFLSNKNIYQNWHLLIVGPINKENQPFWNQLKSKDSANKLHLLGSRKDIPELLAASDLAIFPGTFGESFGLAVVEAALMGLPLLALRSGSIPYVLGQDYSGLFYKTQRDSLLDIWAILSPDFLISLANEIDKDALKDMLSQSHWESELMNMLTFN